MIQTNDVMMRSVSDRTKKHREIRERHTSISFVFGILQLISQKPQHARVVGLREIYVVEPIRAANHGHLRCKVQTSDSTIPVPWTIRAVLV